MKDIEKTRKLILIFLSDFREGIYPLTTKIVNATYHIPFPTSESEVSYELKEKN